jgi:hypothetical protein
MTAGVHNIIIEQGSVFTLPLVWKDALGVPISVAGYKARMQIRKAFKSPDPPLISLTSDAGDIVLGGALGTITAKIIAENTAALEIKQGVYDLELVPPSGEDDAFRFIEGVVIVTPEVTR